MRYLDPRFMITLVAAIIGATPLPTLAATDG